jgi:hypothetical protein
LVVEEVEVIRVVLVVVAPEPVVVQEVFVL